jgi:hypothetical protein
VHVKYLHEIQSHKKGAVGGRGGEADKGSLDRLGM